MSPRRMLAAAPVASKVGGGCGGGAVGDGIATIPFLMAVLGVEFGSGI